MSYTKYIFLLFLLTALSPIYSQVETVNIPFENPTGAKKLNIDLFQSSIKIIGTDRSDLLVRYEIMQADEEEHMDKDNKTAGLKKISGANVNLEMTCQNNVASIHSKNWNRYITVVIEVPRNIELDIHKNMGDTILIERINGNINIENNIGDIIVKNTSGVVNASNTAGNIFVHFDKIPEAKSMIFNSTTGEVDLTLPTNYKADLKMKTEMGEIYSDLDLVINKNPVSTEAQNENGHFKYSNAAWTYASLNQGGPVITIKSKIGSIYLRKQ